MQADDERLKIKSLIEAHGLAFVKAYNFAKRLTSLRWKTPFEPIVQA